MELYENFSLTQEEISNDKFKKHFSSTYFYLGREKLRHLECEQYSS